MNHPIAASSKSFATSPSNSLGVIVVSIRSIAHLYGDVRIASAAESVADWRGLFWKARRPRRQSDESGASQFCAIKMISPVELKVIGLSFEFRWNNAQIDHSFEHNFSRPGDCENLFINIA